MPETQRQKFLLRRKTSRHFFNAHSGCISLLHCTIKRRFGLCACMGNLSQGLRKLLGLLVEDATTP
ncbi:predicted protein [Botrytis cinerea T4]|uniref:Uncharacterized protein n=1 Tax=Botryotinia fuckeliana (strain T4) TaxID=999810 RepID=G2XT24_BOTF4|nr:predicted protein [Botrytis cinerea T4]